MKEITGLSAILLSVFVIILLIVFIFCCLVINDRNDNDKKQDFIFLKFYDIIILTRDSIINHTANKEVVVWLIIKSASIQRLFLCTLFLHKKGMKGYENKRIY